MSTITSIVIIIALGIAFVWAWCNNVKLRKSREQDIADAVKAAKNEAAKVAFAEGKKFQEEIGALTKQLKEATENYDALSKEYLDLKEEYSRKDQRRNEKGWFVRADGTYTPKSAKSHE